jgi:DNA-binding MarR family transcriptional regulator
MMTRAPKPAFDAFVDGVRRVFFILRALSESMLADLDCTAVERGILSELEKGGPQSVPALADSRRISRQAMQKAVDGMIEGGLVATKPNPRHQRSVLVAPTSSGMQLLHEIRTREARLFAKVDLPISERELRAAHATLAAVADRLGEPGVAEVAAYVGSKVAPRRARKG